MRVVDGRAEFFTAHWQRFERGCRVLGLPIPKASDFRQDIARLCSDEGICSVKWIYTRGSGLRGYRISQPQRCRRVVFHSAVDRSFYAQRAQTGVRVRFGTLRLSQQPLLAGIKHLNRLENVLARQEWDDDTISESLLFDTQDNLIEGVMSNVFVLRSDCWWTPRLDGCGICGVIRDVVIRLLRVKGQTGVYRQAWPF